MSVRTLFDLGGRIALVTGGSRGLGLQVASALGEMGAKVALTARKGDELEAARAQLAREGVEAFPVPCDLSRPEAVAPMVDVVLAKCGQIDILVNNAGATWGAPAEAYPDEAWHKVMNLNVNAMFFLSREVGRRAMIPRKSGRIINVASIAGLGGNRPGTMSTIAYNTSKGAVVNYTRALAAEWGKHGITV
ncbi:MAG TPA: SDR family NAD(P)-dependent oxidoreductase, partial [Burkholderiales bacterium]|nr:SDR family NAD(P)-dependent oxidoreductase [Burkholderiales bacterium]